MQKNEQQFSFKHYFVPFTTIKAVHIIIITGSIVFFNCLFNGFVGDDNGQIVSNNLVHSVMNIPHFFTSSTFNLGNGISGFYFKPLLLTTFTLIYSILGQAPFFFHFFQLALYIVNAILVFLFLKRFLHKQIAIFLAVIFLVHPMNEEVASYISNYQDLLFFFFGMMALLFSSTDKSTHVQVKVFSMLALSLLSKETGIIFCFLNVLYVFFFQKERIKITLLSTGFLIVPYGILRTNAVGLNIPHDFRIGRLSLFERMENIPAMVMFYLLTFTFPIILAVSYDWVVSGYSFSGFYIPLAVVLAFCTTLLITGRVLKNNSPAQFRIFLFFCLWLLLGLSIHLQLIPLDGTVATRWFYLPMVGLLGVMGIIYQTFVKDKKVHWYVLAFLLPLFVLFAARTAVRNTNFQDNRILMCHDANETHNNFSLENSCGVSLFAAGKYDEAQGYFARSVVLAPYFGTNWWGLGVTYGRKAEMQKSSLFFDKSVYSLLNAIRIEPSVPWSYESLGYLYAHYQDTKTAKRFLENSLKKFPNSYSLWFNMAYAEYKAGSDNAALQAIDTAYELNPNDSQIARFYYHLHNNIPIQIEHAEL